MYAVFSNSVFFFGYNSIEIYVCCMVNSVLPYKDFTFALFQFVYLLDKTIFQHCRFALENSIHLPFICVSYKFC